MHRPRRRQTKEKSRSAIGLTRERRSLSFAATIFLLLSSFLGTRHTTAQEKATPLNPNDPRLAFSFPIQSGGKPFEFKVLLDQKGVISGLSIRRKGDLKLLQTLPKCGRFPDQVNSFWDECALAQLVAPADLNFDGFQDLELLQNYIPHLGKRLACLYLWDPKTGSFKQSEELGKLEISPETHPESGTLTTHEDWQGGTWQESRYRWNAGKLELVEQSSLTGESSEESGEPCTLTLSCSKRIAGRMVTTLEKPACTPEQTGHLPDCPTDFHDNTPDQPNQ